MKTVLLAMLLTACGAENYQLPAAKKPETKTEETKEICNGRMEEMLHEAREKAYAQGVLDGMKQQATALAAAAEHQK